MKLKLTQPGYEYMNGAMGITEFIDGVSVGDVHPHDARNIAISIGCEWEDGTSPNPAQSLLDNMTVQAVVVEEGEKETPHAFSIESLEAVADKDGIKGLREIATPLGITGTSIKDLITKLIALTIPAGADIPTSTDPETPEVPATPEATATPEAPAESETPEAPAQAPSADPEAPVTAEPAPVETEQAPAVDPQTDLDAVLAGLGDEEAGVK